MMQEWQKLAASYHLDDALLARLQKLAAQQARSLKMQTPKSLF